MTCVCDLTFCPACDDVRAAEYARSGLPVSESFDQLGSDMGGPETFDDMGGRLWLRQRSA